jgi:hypothetical protein
MNFFSFKHRLDDYFYELVNRAMVTHFIVQKALGKKKFMKANVELHNKHKDRRGFLVANGPSINSQNLKLLKNEITFFVNRSFLHKDYSYIEPTYHIFVDNKLATGEWPISFLDEVLRQNNDVIFLLNAKWYKLEKFQKYINNNKFKIYWVDMKLFTTPFDSNRTIDLTKITYGAAVTGVAKMGMIYMGIKDIYFLGKDGNGLCYELTNTDSHFYGFNSEDKLKDMKDIHQSLYMMALSTKHWIYFSRYCKKIGVRVINLTDGGIFDMFERGEYEKILKNDKP